MVASNRLSTYKKKAFFNILFFIDIFLTVYAYGKIRNLNF